MMLLSQQEITQSQSMGADEGKRDEKQLAKGNVG